MRARAPADLFLGRGCPGHGEFRLSDGLIHTSRSIVGRASQVGPLGRRSLQQLAARTALSGTDRVFHCRAGYCTRPPPQPTLGPRWHQRIQRPVPSAAIAGIQMNCMENRGAGAIYITFDRSVSLQLSSDQGGDAAPHGGHGVPQPRAGARGRGGSDRRRQQTSQMRGLHPRCRGRSWRHSGNGGFATTTTTNFASRHFALHQSSPWLPRSSPDRSPRIQRCGPRGGRDTP